MVTLLGFAALAIDMGYLYVVRAQLQNAADAAALAGATAYFTDTAERQDQTALRSLIVNRAQQFSVKNRTTNQSTILDAADVQVGRQDLSNYSSPLSSSGYWNAVDVTVRRTAGSRNGPVNLFFANIFGISHAGTVTGARAAVDDRFAGYSFPVSTNVPTALIPFVIRVDTYNSLLAAGTDRFSYNPATDTVSQTSDGLAEAKLFPWKEWKLQGVDAAAGNFGTLNIGTGLGTPNLERQITYGISGVELQTAFGGTQLSFYDSQGQPQTYLATGNPGLSTGFKDAVYSRIGDVVGFFLFSSVTLNGSNATFVICGLRFARIVDSSLTGSAELRFIDVQPAPYTDQNVVVDVTAPSTHGYVGRIMLVR
jgi:hypothetical protein